MRQPFTETYIRRLKPREGRYSVWCSEVPGWGCRVSARTGRKVFIVQGVPAGGTKQKSIKIGAFNTMRNDSYNGGSRVIYEPQARA